MKSFARVQINNSSENLDFLDPEKQFIFLKDLL